MLTPVNENEDPIDVIIKKYENHPSVLAIKKKVKIPKQKFSFLRTNFSDIEEEIKSLNVKKSSTFKNIPVKYLKLTYDICSPKLNTIWHNAIENSTFPSRLKFADITPTFKQGDKTSAKNYRPISVLPVVSKIFERLMQNQMFSYVEQYLSPFLCGYRKGFSTQYALVELIEKWKKIVDNQGYSGAILMDLSKAFDTINHDLLLAKLHGYGFDKQSLRIIKSYLTERWHRTKIIHSAPGQN